MPKRPRFRPLRRVDALVAALVGLSSLFAASRLFYVTDTTVQPWPRLWPILFAVSGLACLWFAWCSLEVRCRFLTAALSWSGALTITAYTSRALILALTAADNDTAIQTAKLHLGVAVWLTLALVIAYIWLHVFRPAVELSKQREP
jgi:hypothetical protein